MTRQTQKTHEKHIATEAARLLSWRCTLVENEQPDFIIVTHRGNRFGLELSQLFAGPQNRKGSKRKINEMATQRRIDEIKSQYERQTGIALAVQLVGDMSDASMNAIVPTLITLNLLDQQPGSRTRVTLDCGPAQLSLHIRRTIPGHARWYSINDRVGWVDRSPQLRIQDSINAKASSLPSYRERTGISDQRLLIYCDATTNSGKMRAVSALQIDPAGFNAIYFCTYPETATVLAHPCS